jgi:hypothetical protein
MPRKLIPPSEPLPVDLQERLEVFKKYTVEHAMLTCKDDELTQRIWEPGGFAFREKGHLGTRASIHQTTG